MVAVDIEEKLRKLAAVDQRQAELAWLLYLSGEGTERNEAEELIDIALFQAASKSFPKAIFLDPAPPTMCEGSYRLGDVIYPPERVYSRFGLREDEWIKHVLIAGMTGMGKTNLAFQILRELHRHAKPFLIFDWKRNYRDLRQLPEFEELRILSVGVGSTFRFNPLIPPPGTTPGEWLMKLVDVTKHAYFVGEGVEYLLRDAIDAVYEQCGTLGGTDAQTPTFHAVKARVAMRNVFGRMALWKASAMRVLESLCFRHGLGPIVNGRQWDYTTLLRSDVVLELDALADADKVFLIEALILWLYEFRKNEGGRETFKHALIIEEGHHVLSHHKENAEGAETIMETSLRQIREFGEAVIVIDQEPTKLSNSIKANTYTKITFNLGNGKDVLDMALCMGLTGEEAECVNQLTVGHAVVSLRGRVKGPMLVRFPRVGVVKGGGST